MESSILNNERSPPHGFLVYLHRGLKFYGKKTTFLITIIIIKYPNRRNFREKINFREKGFGIFYGKLFWPNNEFVWGEVRNGDRKE